jgi:hypothetical protein
MIRGNKGEWSEIYVLLKLLSEGKVYSADENTKRIDDDYFPIIKIFRAENNALKYEYLIDDAGEKAYIVLNGTLVGEFDTEILNDEALQLLHAISTKPGGASFSVEDTEVFINTIGCTVLKAPVFNSRGAKLGKTDITMQIHDPHTGRKPVSGFSIKSRLGNAATLLNASGATNFVYEITGLTEHDIDEINAINTQAKVRDRISAIRRKGAGISFSHMSNKTFASNLELVDLKFRDVLAYSLLYYYGGEANTCLKLIEMLAEKNPLGVSNPNYYKRNYKQFLVDVTLGMEPNTPWDGNDEAEGGCVWVKEDGEVLVYYIWNHNKLEDYLLRNTKFDTPSTGRHNFASLYKIEDRTYMNLNLQVRFIK